MVKFIPGLTLSRRFYGEAVRPILAAHFPDLAYSAALIGAGSEILGFDDVISTDHHWGPRLMLFLLETDRRRLAQSISNVLAAQLPASFLGYSTNFTPPDPKDSGTQHLQPIEAGQPINHRVEIFSIPAYFYDYLGHDLQAPLTPADWLAFSEQKLLAATTGAIYHDQAGLAEARAKIDYYPQEVWLYLLAAGWARIGQEEHLMGRAGMVGDEIGSALIAGRLVQDVMHLCFLMTRVYAPYPKWFGTAFQKLASAERLTPILQAVLRAPNWRERDAHLGRAYEILAEMHNELQLTAGMPAKSIQFHGRPFNAIAIHGFADALLNQIRDPEMKHIVTQPPIGSVNQFSHSADLLEYIEWQPKLRQLFDPNKNK